MIGHHDHNRRKGQIIVFFVSALVIVCGMAVLAIDIGHLSRSRSRLQNAADAASLAAMSEHYAARSRGESRRSARQAGAEEGRIIAETNYEGVRSEATWGRWEDEQFVQYDSDIPANAVRLQVFRDADAPGGAAQTFFGGVLGINDVNQEAVGIAHFDNPSLAPFAVYEEDMASIGSEMTFYDDEEVAPGVFGMLNFDGGDQSARDLKEWTANGWDEKVIIDPDDGYVKFNGATGLKSSISQAAGDHIETGEVVVGCVYSNVEGKSSNSTFYVVGFVSMTITDQKLVDEEYEYIVGRVEGIYMADTGISQGNMRETVRLHLVK